MPHLMHNATHSLIDAQRDEEVMHVRTKVLIIIAYSILCMVSTFGNSLVCYVILKNKRLHTPTNFFLANLAVSDLLVTFINVPFNIAKNLLDDWPFGQFPCHMVTYSLALTSYVSTYTLTSIAIDRQRVVLKPLTRRMSTRLAISILAGIWIMAIGLSLPYGMYTRVDEVQYLITKEFRRCRFIRPNGWKDFEKYLTIATFIVQYCIPFTLIGIAYSRIVRCLWARTHVGAVTANQQLAQARAKLKSIKLLIAVVIIFAVCWLPLNMYHILTDLHPNPTIFQYSSKTFFVCHWIAISSTCYNPFVYCWLNEQFRAEVKSRFYCCYIACRRPAHSSGLLDVIVLGETHPKTLSSCCYNSIKSHTTTTTATSLQKDSTHTTSDNRDNKASNQDSELWSLTGICAEDETHCDVREEATQGLIQSDVNGGCSSRKHK